VTAVEIHGRTERFQNAARSGNNHGGKLSNCGSLCGKGYASRANADAIAETWRDLPYISFASSHAGMAAERDEDVPLLSCRRNDSLQHYTSGPMLNPRSA